MLKFRILTAIILIPLVIWGIWDLSPFAFSIAIAVVIALSAWEWARLVGFTNFFARAAYVILILGALFSIYWLPVVLVLLIGLLAWLWSLLALVNYARGGQPLGFQYATVRFILGFLILIPCAVGFDVMKVSHTLGPVWILFSLLIAWLADTGGYFVGRAYGKHSLAVRVSPKKTWEGFWGGLVTVFILAILGSLFLPLLHGVQRYYFVGLVVIAGLFSVLGDLTVSLLKRQVGVKDSGQLIPGHGGILDRLDSISAVVTVFALGILLISQI